MEKIEALAKFLDIDDLEQIEETSYCFVVNPHTRKQGLSPVEKLSRVNLVKQALDQAGITRVFNFLSADLVPELYKPISKAFYKHCNELTKVGIHDLVNTLYFLCGGSKGQELTSTNDKALSFDYSCLFDGNNITDDRDTIEVNNGEYLVLTDSEANEAWEASQESYIDDCVLPEIPEAYRAYFDKEAYLKDLSIDGRGSNLASYDGEENESGEYYIYRIN